MTVVHMDFPAYTKQDFMRPEESVRQTELYVVDLEELRDTAEEIPTEMNRIEEVDEDDNGLVEETVINEDRHIPDSWEPDRKPAHPLHLQLAL